MTELKDEIPLQTQVPLQELLRDTPISSRLTVELGEYHTVYIPVGKHCHDAADKIQAMQAREEVMIETLEYIAKERGYVDDMEKPETILKIFKDMAQAALKSIKE